MNLHYLSQKGLAVLRKNLPNNLDLYVSGDAGSVLLAMNINLLESRIEAGLPPKLELGSEQFDAENARRLFNWLPHLNPSSASDPRLWTYLTHGPYAEYTATRWPITADLQVSDRVQERYFLEGEGLATLMRNSVARLWWAAYLTHDRALADNFELTRVLFSLQDLQASFMERAIGRSPRILKGVLRLWKRVTSERRAIPNQTKVVKQWAKLIRLHGGVTLLDSLPDQQLQNLLWLKLGIALNEDLPDLGEMPE